MTDLDPPQARAVHSRKRLQLLLLIAVFTAPVIAAWLWQPGSFNNRGELIEPPRLLADELLLRADGERVGLQAFGGKWTYVYFARGGCDAACRQVVDNLARVRLTQGKNARRLRVLVIAMAPGQLSQVETLRLQLPEVVVLGAGAAALARLAQQFKLDSGSPVTGDRRIYLVDPLGNLMMSYPAEADPTDIRKDIARLLRVSRIG
ncbi:MAG TPA: hypothetical protein DG414_06835 [Gammaproteobacteria bacterium]|jgi:hypothetical protein|nr:SCO family protein [Arenicellales bacterium]MDP6855175.1 SCO family protein [Arenicellales bacterium]MDP6948230.1 SCO family protein [Arenicellales bacterium]HCY13537.1 hypothetical protein [Gammaproteobacteria bacterium]|tara:strand:+ start:6684 stop:7298 length:615 start_codon:yes stop_codon:yes gene_type:complete